MAQLDNYKNKRSINDAAASTIMISLQKLLYMYVTKNSYTYIYAMFGFVGSNFTYMYIQV